VANPLWIFHERFKLSIGYITHRHPGYGSSAGCHPELAEGLFSAATHKHSHNSLTLPNSPLGLGAKLKKMRKLLLLAMLCPFLSMCQPITVKGKIINEQGEPVAGATITIKPVNSLSSVVNQLSSDPKGKFTAPNMRLNDTLIVTAVGYETAFETLDYTSRNQITIILKRKTAALDDVVVIAYGTTTRRLATGSISSLSAEQISRQPVSNPLSALQGRIPGLEISQTNGLPGAAIKIQLRGRTAIDPGLSAADPLIIIDGVPFALGNSFLGTLSSAAGNPGTAAARAGGLSPLNMIDPASIQSIEVLKDADATAIYGSRGAAGVILITTKKAAAGASRGSASFYTGFGRPARMVRLLSPAQYRTMRYEALANDGLTPSVSNAPDLLLWDSTRNTNFQDLLLGKTARNTDAQLSLSGGNARTQFLLGTGYHHESTVFPGNLGNRRASVHLSLQHQPLSGRYGLSLTAAFSGGKNNIIARDLSAAAVLPPNFPSLFDDQGNLKWSERGVNFSTLGLDNPMAYLLQRYSLKSDNLLANAQLWFMPFSGFTIRTSLGYNTLFTDEVSLRPKASLNPQSSAGGAASFSNGNTRSYILEPQLAYKAAWGSGKLDVLAGASLQDALFKSLGTEAEGYTSDLLLGSVEAAASVTSSNSLTQYRYAALFGRINYNWKEKYIINLSGRRDGSSRFGPGRQLASFGAVGAAWIFSSEKWGHRLSLLSFGKLRASYGSSGNDQIGDYKYLDSWTATNSPYNGLAGLRPSRLFNPGYSWQVSRKLEAALDLGFFSNRLLLSAAWYRNRSSNQLVNYPLPVQTGFTSIVLNLPALVQNTGLEISVTSKNIEARNLSWSSSFTVSVPRNKLVSFPGLASSSYANNYVEGEPLTVIYRYKFLGVDPATGVYSFLDPNGDSILNNSDRVVLGSLSPKFYGGFGNDISYRSWVFSCFFEFRKTLGLNYLASLTGSNIPGFAPLNQPVAVWERWQHPGDAAAVQRFIGKSGNPAYTAAASYMPASNGVYSDASFIRLKNISLAYELPGAWLQKRGLQNARLYINAQNLLTFTRYKGADPETQNFLTLPPMRTIVAGFQLTF
jgi:TonB-dependent starch-binding outer membrane protein SusC